MTGINAFLEENITSVSDAIRWALLARSEAQYQCCVDFDRTDRLQEAYVILFEVYAEAKRYEEEE